MRSAFTHTHKQSPEVVCEKGFLKNLEATLLKKKLQHGCFPVNFAKFFRTPFLQNTFRRRILTFDRLPHNKLQEKLLNIFDKCNAFK